MVLGLLLLGSWDVGTANNCTYSPTWSLPDWPSIGSLGELEAQLRAPRILRTELVVRKVEVLSVLAVVSLEMYSWVLGLFLKSPLGILSGAVEGLKWDTLSAGMTLGGTTWDPVVRASGYLWGAHWVDAVL